MSIDKALIQAAAHFVNGTITVPEVKGIVLRGLYALGEGADQLRQRIEDYQALQVKLVDENDFRAGWMAAQAEDVMELRGALDLTREALQDSVDEWNQAIAERDQARQDAVIMAGMIDYIDFGDEDDGERYDQEGAEAYARVEKYKEGQKP